MSYDEAALDQIDGVPGGPEFVKTFVDFRNSSLHDPENPTALDALDMRLLRIIRELDR
jgi:hypothetical protein